MSKSKELYELEQDLKTKIYYKDIEAGMYDGTGNPLEAAAKQIGGSHYVQHNIMPWDIIDEYGLDFYRGNAIKYILRNKMDTYEDIEKAKHYLEKWLEVSACLKK